MKIILTGTTGFIGQEVLAQCLSNPSITSLVALTRRDSHYHYPSTVSKLHVHLMQDGDFLSYSDPELIKAIQGADACIWSLGIVPSQAKKDEELNRRVSVDYTVAAAKAFQEAFGFSEVNSDANMINPARNKRFRFVYVSGFLAERDQSKSLWFAQDLRRIRGESENVLIAHGKSHPGAFEYYILRPGMVLTKNNTWVDVIRGLAPSVRVDVIARAMIKAAVHGDQKRMIENADISRLAG
ncbi:hypothetical protein MPDQ_002451 [Monascus purpureus]|uniref:NAD(P)-binding domain-containing protein n=1 Tax=Monascus purpureus TaxID=5098 RepID=A0A507QKG2_MONPU|nr:hypothetical protein MPDQ_002451 [Monascus purpureus]BDD54870.1 hypothetical protein MAP00_000445 [Monascus purpureus]